MVIIVIANTLIIVIISWEGVQWGDTSMEYIETQFQLADVFTKVLYATTLIKLRDMLVVCVDT